MRVLVTRPAEDGAATAARVTALGHQAVVAPLMTVRFLPDAVVPLDGVQALLVTSANGARALAASGATDEARTLPVLAVGTASAEACRAAGFARVEAAGGDVDSLATLIRARFDPAAGPLLHVAGSVTAGDLAGTLRPEGFEVRRAVLYEAEPADALPAPARDALSDGAIDAVLLFSPRTARLFAALVRDAGLGEACHAVVALCLSPAVAEALDGLALAEVRVAATPNQEALLALLDPIDCVR